MEIATTEITSRTKMAISKAIPSSCFVPERLIERSMPTSETRSLLIGIEATAAAMQGDQLHLAIRDVVAFRLDDQRDFHVADIGRRVVGGAGRGAWRGRGRSIAVVSKNRDGAAAREGSRIGVVYHVGGVGKQSSVGDGHGRRGIRANRFGKRAAIKSGAGKLIADPLHGAGGAGVLLENQIETSRAGAGADGASGRGIARAPPHGCDRVICRGNGCVELVLRGIAGVIHITHDLVQRKTPLLERAENLPVRLEALLRHIEQAEGCAANNDENSQGEHQLHQCEAGLCALRHMSFFHLYTVESSVTGCKGVSPLFFFTPRMMRRELIAPEAGPLVIMAQRTS